MAELYAEMQAYLANPTNALLGRQARCEVPEALSTAVFHKPKLA